MFAKVREIKSREVYHKPMIGEVACPCCKSDDVSLSRLSKEKPFYRRMFFVYYKCYLCSFRFKRTRLSWAIPLVFGVCVATILNFVMVQLR